MASPGWPSHARFCSFPDMFSFSLDPEILSFLWATSPQRTDVESTLRYNIAHPSELFHIFLSSDAEQATLLSTLYYTVTTTGILLVVGASSVCTFHLLQCMRQGIRGAPIRQNVRSLFVNLSRPLVLRWRKFKGDDMRDTLTNSNSNGNQAMKRPPDLRIVPNGSPITNRVMYSRRDSSLERRLLCKDPTPLADCDIASGEEDIGEIQGQYFGPTVGSQKHCMDLLGSSPEDTPTHALPPKKESPRKSPKKRNRLDSESSC